MRVVIQKVLEASVQVNNQVVCKIQNGLVGICRYRAGR